MELSHIYLAVTYSLFQPRHPSQTPPRGKTNFTSRCKLCSYQNTLDIKEDTIVSYDAEDVNNFKTIVVFSCRGLEPVDFDPKDGWQAHGYTENVDSDDSEGQGQSVIRLQIYKSSKASSLVELTQFLQIKKNLQQI